MKKYKKEISKSNNTQGASLISVLKPLDIISEQFRTIRTNIQYSMVDKNFKTIMITSSGEKEGKSTVSANLASVMSDENKKVLLIDADMRKPTLHKTFNLENTVGITSLLTNPDLDLASAIEYSEIANLYLLPVGPIPPNPVELLSSKSMGNLVKKLESMFDLIVIDTPPVLAVADSQVMASLVDGAIFVIREGVASSPAVKKAIELLNITGVNIIGGIYNGANINKREGYYGYIRAYNYEDK